MDNPPLATKLLTILNKLPSIDDQGHTDRVANHVKNLTLTLHPTTLTQSPIPNDPYTRKSIKLEDQLVQKLQ